MTNYPISRKANIVVQDLENEVLIYDLNINKAFCLNQTAGLVYQLCDGKRTVAEISDLMSKELKTLVSEDFVWLAVDGLKQDGLLENAGELADHFGGVSRREVVKRVGLASMVMLPLISSVVVPSAVMALSETCPVGICINGGVGPGREYCMGCEGRTVTLDLYSSINGTCSPFQQTVTMLCDANYIAGLDYIITMVV
ncbi:MAG: PqqD family peptide modification chaperone [Pyrinomonadaceae bacterium]|nr:PqqD family peptide modification chaperone [Pyrinomonadaceae bacterium]